MRTVLLSSLFSLIPAIQTTDNRFLASLSSPVAIEIYLGILMLLIALLAGYILIALHTIRRNTESLQDDASGTKQEKKKRHGEPRFSALSRIDEAEKTVAPGTGEEKPLHVLCQDFRHFAASRLGLYYDVADIRRFVAGMGVGRLILLRGMSGTGKTSLAYAAGEFFGNPATVVAIQPMWKERSDIIGYFNEFTKRFNETPLLCKLYEAGDREEVYITVLDEVNISRIEYYFAEFLSLLELPDPKKRELVVVSDAWDNDPKRLHEGKLLLPENMWFVGTANNDDSTFSISDKVYDRAAVIDLEKKSTPFHAADTPPSTVTYAGLTKRFAEAKEQYCLSETGRAKLMVLDRYLAEVFRVSFGNRIMRQIEEYVPIMLACGGSEDGALDDMLSRKILRKLEQLSPTFVRNEIPALLALLDEQFGPEALPLCREFLRRLVQSA